MSLAGVKHPGKIQAIQWCNCRGKQHRVALINNGIVLLDHRLELELAMLDLGGEACGCMKVFLDIRSRETKRVIPSFGPYLEEMLRKKRKRQYGNHLPIGLKQTHYATKSVQRLVRLLVRFKCDYEGIPDDTLMHITATGGSAFIKGTWVYRGEIGGKQDLLLQMNIDKDWWKNVYDKGIAVVDDKIILSSKGRNNNFGDTSVVAMDYDAAATTFGTRNATIMNAHGKWRFKYMESQVNHNPHHAYKRLAR
jgi:hypothetical protein